MTDRDGLKRQFPRAFERLNAILFEEDPVGINFGDNSDEYESETGAILPRLAGCTSASDLEEVIHEEFVRWFDAATAGPQEKYATIALRVWNEVVPVLTEGADGV